jgi:hypothetical protein
VPTARPEVAAALGVVRGALRALRDGLLLVSRRHPREYELWSTAAVLSGWIDEDAASLEPCTARYGLIRNRHPQAIGAAVLGPAPRGLRGTLAELTDLSLLAHQVEMAWTIVFQGAKELQDRELLATAAAGRNHADRVIRWIRTQVDHIAPEALAVGPGHR